MNGIEIDLKELAELERRVAAKKKAASEAASSSSVEEKLEESFEKSLKISETVAAPPAPHPPASLASMFLVLMSVFSILNQIHFKPTAQS